MFSSYGALILSYNPPMKIGSVFEATVDATEEAIINALVAAETMVGVDGHRAEAIPHDRLRDILRKYNRLATRR